MLNAGYKRGATIPRCVGDAKSMRIQRFRVFAPVALAGLAGNMPATITTRSITIHMRRRAPGETVEPFEEEDAERDAEPIRDALAAWTATPAAGDAVRIRPELPAGVVDRAAEVWRPLVAVADAAAGHWPELARDACRHFVLDRGPEAVSLGVRLLADLRAVYRRLGVDRLATVEALRELVAIEEAPWSDLYGKPLDARRLARELDRYAVRPGPLRIAGQVVKGYQTTGPTGLADAWSRYLPPEPVTSVTAVADQLSPVTETGAVTDPAVTPDPPVTAPTSTATAVTASNRPGRASSRPAPTDPASTAAGRPTATAPAATPAARPAATTAAPDHRMRHDQPTAPHRPGPSPRPTHERRSTALSGIPETACALGRPRPTTDALPMSSTRPPPLSRTEPPPTKGTKR